MGALGAALCTMVGNYTVGKKKYADVEEDVKALMARAEDNPGPAAGPGGRRREAFEPLSKAYAIPRTTPAGGRDGEVPPGCRRHPHAILRLSCEAIDLHREMLDKGSVIMLSDVGTGVIFCQSALYGAAST